MIARMARSRRCVSNTATLEVSPAMPMPREEDDDLFHDVDDVDFEEDASDEAADEDDGESEKKTKKKKTAKKKSTASKSAKTAKTAKKKTAKKAKKKAAKKAKKKPADDGFGAGLDLDAEEAEESPAEAAEEAPAAEPEAEPAEAAEAEASEEDGADEFGRTPPAADHAVHVYELGRLKRTLDRDFTAEEAHAFADSYSKVSKHYGRKAVASKKDTQPAKVLD